MTKHLRFALLLPVLAWLPARMSGQQVVVNNQGERIVVFPDGSWRLMEPADSIYLPKELATTSPAAGEPAPGTEDLDPWTTLSRRIEDEHIAAQAAFRQATNLQFKAAEANRNARENAALLSAEQLRGFDEAYETSVDRLARARKREQAIAGIHADARRLAGEMREPGTKAFARLEADLSDYLARYVPGAPPLQTQGLSEGPPDQGNERTKPTGQPAVRRSLCTYTRDAIDPLTGFRVRETAQRPLFFHTDPELRPFFKNKDLITCRASLSGNGPSTTLLLAFEIASANSMASFGGIAQGALMRLKLMDGNLLTLYNQASDRGHIDAYSGHTVFTARYPIGREELRQLEQAELDKIRVLWITGYEDYEIIYTDCLREQLACLAAE